MSAFSVSAFSLLTRRAREFPRFGWTGKKTKSGFRFQKPLF
jgi:hypothetical protein